VGLQGLSLRKVARIEQVTGLTVLRATLNNGGDSRTWWFVTADHRHGTYTPGTSKWSLLPDVGACTSPMCDWLFGPVPRPRDDTWGVVCPDGQWRVRQDSGRVPQTWPG
jgi:hypothetical protein